MRTGDEVLEVQGGREDRDLPPFFRAVDRPRHSAGKLRDEAASNWDEGATRGGIMRR